MRIEPAAVAGAVKAAATEAENGIKQGVAELTKQVARMPALKPMLEMLQSVKVQAAEGTVTITANLKGAFTLPMMMPLLLFSAWMGPMELPGPDDQAIPAPAPPVIEKE